MFTLEQPLIMFFSTSTFCCNLCQARAGVGLLVPLVYACARSFILIGYRIVCQLVVVDLNFFYFQIKEINNIFRQVTGRTDVSLWFFFHFFMFSKLMDTHIKYFLITNHGNFMFTSLVTNATPPHNTNVGLTCPASQRCYNHREVHITWI